MQKDSVKSTIKTIGIECESIEGPGWGVGRLIKKLLEELPSKLSPRHKYRFILYSKGQLPESVTANLDKSIFELRPCGILNSFSLYYYLLLPLRLWRDKPDAMYWPNYMLPLIAPPSVKSLVMLTEDVWYAMRDKNLALRYRLGYGIFARWAAWRASYVMAISKSSRDSLMKLFRILPERIVVNELAIERPAAIGSARTGNYLLYVGQAFERRRLRESLAAFQDVATEFPDLQFHIIGPDRYSPPLIEATVRILNQRLGRQAVIWQERASDEELASAYAGAQALIYVSDIEAFGLPPLEALSYGTPAIVADTPVNREIYGDKAFFVSEPSVTSLAAVMRSAITNRKKLRYIETTAESVLSRYTWQTHAERFLKIIDKLTS